MRNARRGLARTLAILIVTLVLAVAAGAYVLSTAQPSGTEIHLSITETDAVNQIDSFIPQNLTVKQGASASFVVINNDDENRTFTISALNFNMTIPPHTTARSSFTPDKTGTFVMYSPQTKPSAASNGKPGSPVTGYLTVTS